MAKKPAPEPAGDDVPLWFMTYSDVITLMMTFFILLLTFATNEPERFEQMKVSVFGASGANGLIGEQPDGTEKDSWVLRVRSRASRLTDRGSEVPPIDKDTATESMNKGLSGLEDEGAEIVDTFAVVVPGSTLGSADGELYEYGQHNMKMLANMMRTRSYELTIEISRDSQLNRALACIQFLYHIEGIHADRLSVCQDRFPDLDGDSLRLTLRHFQSTNHGETREDTTQ